MNPTIFHRRLRGGEVGVGKRWECGGRVTGETCQQQQKIINGLKGSGLKEVASRKWNMIIITPPKQIEY